MILDPTQSNIDRIAEHLKTGGIAAIPTETVYGLGANATDDKAVARIFAAKGRPTFNPVIVHCIDKAQAEECVVFNEKAELLATLFWPGALTLVLPRRDKTSVSLLCSAGLPTLAVRCPSHPVARKLIETLGYPIAAPSANTSGTLSPTTPAHVLQSLGDKAEFILAGGKSEVGLESAVIDLTGDVPILLRAGSVTLEELQMHLGEVIIETEGGDKPKSPGQLLRHYAPKTRLRLQAVDVAVGEALLAFGSIRFMSVQGGGGIKDMPDGSVLNLSDNGDVGEAAANLFAMLHQLDAGDFSGIAVMDIPMSGLGMAINDRLNRAASAQINS